ncbi:hypothetical protein CTI14_69445, partial [Methylobacterium radiotolerans]
RLEREFDMDIITTAPSVVYEVEQRDGSVITVEAPRACPRSASRSAWSANSTWTSSPPRRRWCTRSSSATGP